MRLLIESLIVSILLGIVAATPTSTIIVTVSAAPTADSRSFTDNTQFQKDILNTHNYYRNEHNASALQWNDSLVDYGSDWADKCEWKHSGGPTGENLAAGQANASAVVKQWVVERDKYNFKKQGFSEATGHFTQVVWKSTTTVGCGRRKCSDPDVPGWYTVCEYYPPGNVEDEYNQNVDKQQSGPKDSGGSVTSTPIFPSTFLAALTAILWIHL